MLIDYLYQQSLSFFQRSSCAKNSTINCVWCGVILGWSSDFLRNFPKCVRVRIKCTEKTYVNLWSRSIEWVWYSILNFKMIDWLSIFKIAYFLIILLLNMSNCQCLTGNPITPRCYKNNVKPYSKHIKLTISNNNVKNFLSSIYSCPPFIMYCYVFLQILIVHVIALCFIRENVKIE